MLFTLSLELRTAAAWGGMRTTWCGVSCRGSHTLAGRFRFNVPNSPSSLVVFASLVSKALNSFPMQIRLFINSNSAASRGAWKHNFPSSLKYLPDS